MNIDDDRLETIKKSIAVVVDVVEDIPHLLMMLACVPREEWEVFIENSKRHKITYVSGICLICQSPYERWIPPYYDGMCQSCQDSYQHEGSYIALHRSRAKKLNCPATLRLAEWVVNKQHFNFLCAYCQQEPGTVLEHFLPLTLGGGTVAENVVPCCGMCNRKKRNTHPDKITTIPRADIERVREFLNSLKIAPKKA